MSVSPSGQEHRQDVGGCLAGQIRLPPYSVSPSRLVPIWLANLAISLTAEQFRYGFGNALPEQESAELYDRWTVPSPG